MDYVTACKNIYNFLVMLLIYEGLYAFIKIWCYTIGFVALGGTFSLFDHVHTYCSPFIKDNETEHRTEREKGVHSTILYIKRLKISLKGVESLARHPAND